MHHADDPIGILWSKLEVTSNCVFWRQTCQNNLLASSTYNNCSGKMTHYNVLKKFTPSSNKIAFTLTETFQTTLYKIKFLIWVLRFIYFFEDAEFCIHQINNSFDYQIKNKHFRVPTEVFFIERFNLCLQSLQKLIL